MTTFSFAEGFDPKSPEGAEMLKNFCQESFRMMFDDLGQVPPHFVSMFERGVNGELLDSPKMLVMSNPVAIPFDEVGKEIFSSVIKGMCKVSGAFGAAFISEAWAAQALNEDPNSLATMEHFKGNLGSHPDRKEIVMLHLEHTAWTPSTKVFFANITREEGGKATLGEWTEYPESSAIVGRFAGLLASDTNTAKLARERLSEHIAKADVFPIGKSDGLEDERNALAEVVNKYHENLCQALGYHPYTMAIKNDGELAVHVWARPGQELPESVTFSTPEGTHTVKLLRGEGNPPADEDADAVQDIFLH